MTHASEVRMRFDVKRNWFMVPILREKFSLMWIESYLFCVKEMCFFLCKFRNSGKFGYYLVDSVLIIEKVKFVTVLAREWYSLQWFTWGCSTPKG